MEAKNIKTMKNINELTRRAAYVGMTFSELFIESGKSYQASDHWKKQEPRNLQVYLDRLKEEGLEIDIHRTTYEQLGSRAEKVLLSWAIQMSGINRLWSKRDPQVIETYKLLLKTLEHYETNGIKYKSKPKGRTPKSKLNSNS